MFEGYNYVDKNGQGAKSRFSNPAAVRAVYQKLSQDDLPDASRRAKIRKLYDGNLPYDPRVLKATGLANLTNVNFLGLKGVIDNRADAIVRLQSDTANLIEFRPVARELAGPEASKIAKVAAEEFSTMLRSNGRFISALSLMHKEADLYGLGPVTWSNAFDYSPVALERAQVRFIEEGPVESSRHELIMFESTITADYLRSLLDSPEVAAAEGWDIEGVKEWLTRVYFHGDETKDQPGTEGSTTPLESALAAVRKNTLGEEQQFNTMHVIHVFVREVAWPRGITHIVMPSTAVDRFLYQRKHAYRTMDECFLWLPHSTKERYAREVRGLASYLYAIERLNNRFMCQLVDAGFRSASLVLAQQAGAVQPQALTITENGPYTVLPPGVTPSNSQVAPNFQQLIQVKQVLDGLGTASTSGDDKGALGSTAAHVFSGPRDAKPTKAELELQQHLKTQRSEAEFSRKQDTLNKIMKQCFLRALKLLSMDPFSRVDFPEIDEWALRCQMRGVTVEHLLSIPKMFTIVACRDLALGADGKAAELDTYVQLYGGTLDEAGRRYIARERAVLRFGASEADRIIPEVSRDSAPSDQSSFATIENSMMKMGQDPVVGQDQMHWSHIPVHAQVLQQIVEQVKAPQDNTGGQQPSGSLAEQTLQNVEDPRGMLMLLQRCSLHIQEHLRYGGMQIGMADAAKQVEKMLRDLRPTIKALNLAVATQERVEQAQREAQEREMQALRDAADQNELAKEKYKADKQAEIGRYKADLEHDVAMRRLDLAREESASRSAVASRDAEAKAARADRETDAKIDREARIAEAKGNAARALNRMEIMNDATGYSSVQPADIAQEPGPETYLGL